jgi:hypothetical protein
MATKADESHCSHGSLIKDKDKDKTNIASLRTKTLTKLSKTLGSILKYKGQRRLKIKDKDKDS